MVQCPNENDVCISELLLDWGARGQILATIVRGCQEPEEVSQECSSGSSSLVHFKDCTESCTTSGCNSDLNGVAHKFVDGSETRGVSECNTCKYVQGDDGSVTGNKFCLDQPNKIKDIQKECPIYAQEGFLVVGQSESSLKISWFSRSKSEVEI